MSADAAVHRLRVENAQLRGHLMVAAVEIDNLRGGIAVCAESLAAVQAERDRLRDVLVEAVATADEWIGACCGAAVGQQFCEQFGCASVATLVRPLRAALGTDP